MPEKSKLRSLWPDNWSVKRLLQMQADDPITFAKEIQNNPRERLDAKFSEKDYRYWDQEGLHFRVYDPDGRITEEGSLINCRAAIACDLAWEEKRQADRTAAIPGFLTPRANILLDTYFHKWGVKPDKFGDWIFAEATRMKEITGKTPMIGFEKAMLEKVVEWYLGEEMRIRHQPLAIDHLKWDGDKERRITVRLQSRYSAHMIMHKHGMGALEDELYEFPDGAHDDLLDCEQGLVQLLTECNAPRLPKPAAVRDDVGWFARQLDKKIKAAERPHAKYPGSKRVLVPFQETFR